MRSGLELTSSLLTERLGFGALVEEVESVEPSGRIRYRKLEGDGPPEGWVSLRVSGRSLLLPAEDGGGPAWTGPQAPSTPAAASDSAGDSGGSDKPLPAPPCKSGNEMLQQKRWVVVGRGSNNIVQQLLAHLKGRGREVSHVDPYGASGPDVPKRLLDLPNSSAIDVVDLCARADLGEKVIEECIQIGINNVFVQPGAGSSEIEAACAKAGISVHNGCVLREMP